jgi:hypothetical protein
LGKYTDGTARTFSWVVAIMPEIEENKRYELLTADDANTSAATAQAIQSSPPVLICTSAYLQQRIGNPILSYVVNCGPEAESILPEPNASDSVQRGNVAPTFTLFKDRRSALTSINKKVKLDEIIDGASNTMLLSENIQAGTWYHTNVAGDLNWNTFTIDELPHKVVASTPIITMTRLSNAVASLGFIWSNQSSEHPTPGVHTTFHSKINEEYSVGQLDSVPTDWLYARPSSMHPGIVVALYGDGSAKTIDDDCGFGLYLSAVSPNDTKACYSVADGGLGYIPHNPPTTGDFQNNTWQSPPP